MTRPIPVTLLTGFLGAGKTTLLNHLLKQAGGSRIAVIENEFGNEGIDGALVGDERDSLVTLDEGCICCDVRQDLVNALVVLATGTSAPGGPWGTEPRSTRLVVIGRRLDRQALHGGLLATRVAAEPPSETGSDRAL